MEKIEFKLEKFKKPRYGRNFSREQILAFDIRKYFGADIKDIPRICLEIKRRGYYAGLDSFIQIQKSDAQKKIGLWFYKMKEYPLVWKPEKKPKQLKLKGFF